MVPLRSSPATEPSETYFKENARKARESNLTWVRRQLRSLGFYRKTSEPVTWMLLVGGTGIYDFRLRVAQSHLRHDMTPSNWSHAALISTVKDELGDSRLLETSLEPQEGFHMPTMYNGVQGATLDRYEDPEEYPSIALIRIPVDPKLWQQGIDTRRSVLDQFAAQRLVVDTPTLILQWLAFVWGAGGSPNPIIGGQGIPSAAVIQALIASAGYDLCPGLDSSIVSPEAFWQTAKWWQESVTAIGVDTLQTRAHVDPANAVVIVEDDSSTDDSAKSRRPTTSQGSQHIRIPARPRAKRAFLTSELFRNSGK